MRVFIDVAVFELNHLDADSVQHSLEPSKYLMDLAFYIDFQKIDIVDILLGAENVAGRNLGFYFLWFVMV